MLLLKAIILKSRGVIKVAESLLKGTFVFLPSSDIRIIDVVPYFIRCDSSARKNQ